jgi:hypothetical protein
MTSAELRDIFLSAEFKAGLEELSSYLASIMQEAPIVHLLAKCLWKQKRLYALERNNRHDLTVWTSAPLSKENETTIEFKFNYETCSNKLSKELLKAKELSPGNPLAISATLSKWGVMRRVCEDVLNKKPDIFVWIICSRDISALRPYELDLVVNSKPTTKYRVLHPYKTDRAFQTTSEELLELLQKVRPFSVLTAEIDTKGDFRSIYHFRICDFTRSLTPGSAS